MWRWQGVSGEGGVRVEGLVGGHCPGNGGVVIEPVDLIEIDVVQAEPMYSSLAPREWQLAVSIKFTPMSRAIDCLADHGSPLVMATTCADGGEAGITAFFRSP